MELKKIEIEKYKSIKNPVTIELNQGKPVVLIGKNGCGKTNILQAIKYSLSNSYFNQPKEECKVKYYIDLTQNDYETYFKDIDFKDDDRHIIVSFTNGQPDIKLLDAPILSVSIGSYKEHLEKILHDFQSASTKYINALRKIETQNSWFSHGLNPEILSDKGTITNLEEHRIVDIKNNLDYQKKEIKDYLNNLFKEDQISLSKRDYPYAQPSYGWQIEFLQINEEKGLSISPIIAKSLGLKEKDLKKANKKLKQTLSELNQKLSNEYNEIKKCLDEFEQIQAEIRSLFQTVDDHQYEIDQSHKKQVESFVKKLKSIVFRNCYFLDNENSLVFFEKSDHSYRDNRMAYQENLNSVNPIMQAMDNFLQSKNVYQENESILKLNELDENRKKKFIRLINKEFLPQIISNFDKQEIGGFKLDDDFNLFVKEKSGEWIVLDNTSLGRRWYLTYQFIKALLKPGDMLLIDEPAAFLHPQAQNEFRKELESLEGIDVFYTTHSPYMIPEQWGNVHNVMMTEKGTTVQSFDNSDELCDMIRNELGAIGSAEILFNLSKTTLLVEGIADKACIEKFANLLNYDLSAYHIHVCDGEAILQVAYLYLSQDLTNIKVLLDNDNKYKSDYFQRGHSMYQNCIDKINNNSDKCVFVGNGEKGCLEDLFVEDGNKFKYYNSHKQIWKISIDEINKITSTIMVSKQTLKNFEQLFRDLGIPKLDG